MSAVAPRLPWALLAAALPGGAAGMLGVVLLLFLNPQVTLGTGGLSALAVGAALIGGALAVLAQLRGTLRDRGLPLRRLPWALAIVFALFALMFAGHASVFGYHLPAAANSRLLKSAAWFTGAAVALFYTALLHAQQRRRYGWRSRIGLTLGSAFALVAGFERLVTLPRPAAGPAPTVIARTNTTHVLLVEVPGLSLDVLLPLAESDSMALLGRAVREGAYGRLAAVGGTSAVAGRTSLATGALPWRHGVRSATALRLPIAGPQSAVDLLPFGLPPGEIAGASGRVSTRRLQPYLWEIVGAAGSPWGVVGWPSGGMVADNGFAVSAEVFVDPAGAPGPPSAAAVFPPELGERVALFALPDPEVEGILEGRLAAATTALRQAVAADGWRLALAAALLRERGPQLLVVSLPGYEGVAVSSFGGFAASRLGGSRNREATAAGEQLTAYLAWLDGELAQLWELMPPPRLLAVVASDGVAEQPLAAALGLLRGRPLVGGRRALANDGLVVLFGDDSATGTFLAGARVVDVTPTLLYGLGLPAARDLDGRVMTAAFRDSQLSASPITFVESYRGLRDRPSR